MSKEISMVIMICSAFIASISQILLKLSANKEHDSLLSSYLNFNVICGYALLVLTMGMNIIAYSHIEYKYGPVLNSLTYIFVFIMSVIYLKEGITKNKVISIIFIVLGIIIFNIK